MDVVYYRCDKCGFTHQIPEYWSGFAPEKMIEMEHIDLGTGDLCEKKHLELREQEVL